jgi:hypothetical protein
MDRLEVLRTATVDELLEAGGWKRHAEDLRWFPWQDPLDPSSWTTTDHAINLELRRRKDWSRFGAPLSFPAAAAPPPGVGAAVADFVRGEAPAGAPREPGSLF